MKSMKDKRQLAVSFITKRFKEECKARGLSPLNKEERKSIKNNMTEIKKNNGENVYAKKSTQELEILKQRLELTKKIILEDIENGKDSKDSFRLETTNIYLTIVENELSKRNKL